MTSASSGLIFNSNTDSKSSYYASLHHLSYSIHFVFRRRLEVLGGELAFSIKPNRSSFAVLSITKRYVLPCVPSTVMDIARAIIRDSAKIVQERETTARDCAPAG